MQQIQPSKIMLQLHSILSFPQAAARVQANDISQLSNKTLCMQSSINCPPQKKKVASTVTFFTLYKKQHKKQQIVSILQHHLS
jgi:hypothetical protein